MTETCQNCDGRVCMDCVTRTVHDDCGDSPCPVCSAVDRVDALYADEHARLRAENERLRAALSRIMAGHSTTTEMRAEAAEALGPWKVQP